MNQTTDQIRFNPYLPGYFDNPYPFYEELRENDPIHKSFMGSWVITRYADCEEILKHPDFSSDLRNWTGFEKRYQNKQLVAGMLNHNVLNVDPPVHTDLRNYLKKSFMPVSIESLTKEITRVAQERIAGMSKELSFELISSYALAVPLEIICHIFDIPLDQMERAKEWSASVSNLIEPLPDMEALKQAEQGVTDFEEYLRQRILEKEGSQAEDFLSSILNEPLKELIDLDAYLLPNLIMLFAAGHETTVNLIGNGIYALLNNPDQLAALRENPALIDSAVEELLRYDSSQQLAWRSVTKEVTISGHTFQPGEQVMLLIGSANRDPEVFPEPNALDLSRNPNRHLSFGRGRHQCMGAWLARLQGKIAIQSFLNAFPGATYDPEQTEWLSKLSFRGLKQFTIIA